MLGSASPSRFGRYPNNRCDHLWQSCPITFVLWSGPHTLYVLFLRIPVPRKMRSLQNTDLGEDRPSFCPACRSELLTVSALDYVVSVVFSVTICRSLLGILVALRSYQLLFIALTTAPRYFPEGSHVAIRLLGVVTEWSIVFFLVQPQSFKNISKSSSKWESHNKNEFPCGSPGIPTRTAIFLSTSKPPLPGVLTGATPVLI